MEFAYSDRGFTKPAVSPTSFEDMIYAVGCLMVHYLDTEARSKWRLVCKDGLQSVYDETRRLSPAQNHQLHGLTGLPLKLIGRCRALKELSLKGIKTFNSLEGLPAGIEALDLTHTSVTDFQPLLCHYEAEVSSAPGFPRVNPCLRVLILTGMKHGVVASLLPSLRYFPSLRRLDLGYNYLGARGITALAPSLQLMRSMQHLDLQGNYMCLEGAETLAPVIMQLTGLRQLHLGYNKLGPEGIVALAPAIKILAALQVLNLRGKGSQQTLNDVLVF
jgi:hypothetical protein